MRTLPAVLLAVLVALMALAPIANNDIWLHLKTGSLILERGAVPRVDEYTFTRAGAPWVAHEWAAQVLFAMAYRLGGTAALSLLYAMLVGAVLWLVHAGARRAAENVRGMEPGAARGIALLVAAVAFLLMMSFLSIRPHLLTFIFAALYPALLERTQAADAARRRRALALLLATQVVWANLHGGFVVGILLGAIQAAGVALRSGRYARAGLLPAALAGVSLINPYGWRIYGLVSGFNDPFIRQVIVEWRSPFAAGFAGTPSFWLFLTWLAAATAAAVWAARRRELESLMTVVVFGALACTSRRHVGLMAVVTAPLIARGMAALLARGRAPRRTASGARGAAAVAVLIAAGVSLSALRAGSLAARPGVIARNIPVEAVERMREQAMRGHVFTSLGLASYITWGGWPSLLTSADSRLELLGDGFLRTVLTASRDPERFRAFESRWPLDYALLPWRLGASRGALESMTGDRAWALVYFDDTVALYARGARVAQAFEGGSGYRAIDPYLFMTRHGFAPDTDLALAETEARRAIAMVPSIPGRPGVDSVARMMLGSALMRSGRMGEAADTLRAAIAVDPHLAPAYGMLAACLKATGDETGAQDVLGRLERLSPGSVPDDLL